MMNLVRQELIIEILKLVLFELLCACLLAYAGRLENRANSLGY